MADNDPVEEENPPVPPKRAPGHRSTEVKDTVAEMAAKAHEISLEAGSKMAAAMKDVINAAAGITGFVLESARDLVQYMVRRGQMTQEEADKLIRQVEEFRAANGGNVGTSTGATAAAAPVATTPAATAATAKPVAKPAKSVAKPVAKPATSAAAKKPTTTAPNKAPAKTPAKKK